jgi:predicted aspartyl protease
MNNGEHTMNNNTNNAVNIVASILAFIILLPVRTMVRFVVVADIALAFIINVIIETVYSVKQQYANIDAKTTAFMNASDTQIYTRVYQCFGIDVTTLFQCKRNATHIASFRNSIYNDVETYNDKTVI